MDGRDEPCAIIRESKARAVRLVFRRVDYCPFVTRMPPQDDLRPISALRNDRRQFDWLSMSDGQDRSVDDALCRKRRSERMDVLRDDLLDSPASHRARWYFGRRPPLSHPPSNEWRVPFLEEAESDRDRSIGPEALSNGRELSGT